MPLHADPVDGKRIVEAYPNAFLAVLTPEDKMPDDLHRDASDRSWTIAIHNGYLQNVLHALTPEWKLKQGLVNIIDHDHRAAFVCALTALCVAMNRYVAVGDPADGDIALPPLEAWGVGKASKPWAETALRENLTTVRNNAVK